MRKHRYSATNIKQIDWSVLPEQTAGERLVLGVDVAKEDFLEALLSRHWPEAGSILDPGRVSLLALLAHYGDPASVRAEAEAAGQLLRHRGRGMLELATVEKLLDSARDTLGVACSEGERHLLQVVASELLRSHQQIQAIERRIDEEVAADATLTRLARVTGPATSLVLEATLGSPLEYPNAGSYLKAMGLNLKERSSGKHKGQLKITKRGPSLARKYHYFVALRWLYKDPIIAGWYRSKVRRDGRLKGKAIVAIMRKLALALWHIARGEAFDSRKLFDARGLGIHA
jgi:transposase